MTSKVTEITITRFNNMNAIITIYRGSDLSSKFHRFTSHWINRVIEDLSYQDNSITTLVLNPSNTFINVERVS
jgi:hypothetical protein